MNWQDRYAGVWMVGLLVMILAGSPTAALAQPEGDMEAPRIFPLAPRELRQPLTRAEEALQDQRYADAVELLRAILDRPMADDFFLAAPGAEDAQVSLRTRVYQLLGSMPAEARRLYELQSGAEARAMLDEALEAGNVQKLAEVSRRFFHTKAGYEATLLLGKYQLDHGRPLAAALSLQRVTDAGSAAADYDPELSVMLAAAWNLSHMPDKAQEVLLALQKRQPNAKIKLGDQSVALFRDEKQALNWLEDIVGTGQMGRPADESQWVMFRGNASRNARSDGSLPVINFRWRNPTLNDLQDEQRIKDLAKDRLDRGDSLVPALQPLAVNNYLLTRTPDRLLGIDLSQQGKRVWDSWWDTGDPTADATRSSAQNSSSSRVSARELQLRQRVWDDALYGQMSSDGEQLYVVDQLKIAPEQNSNMSRGMWIGGRQTTSTTPYTNVLMALELRSQGKTKWLVGGTNGEDEPALAGAYFVGAPLPIAGQLYVMAEFNGELRLLCLNARTGALEWKQQLAIMEDHLQIRFDSLRRLAGATPSFADGVLVCPTSAGAVVAVELATRSLRWGYAYQRWDAPRRFSGGLNVPSRASNGDRTHWIDGAATIADGKVILTPVESNQLHCLDLLTGEAVWPTQERDDLLYLACVHQKNLIFVGKSDVRAISLADGKPAWPSISLEGETPTGRGFYSDKYYYLPTSGMQLLKIDLDAGKVVAQTKTDIPLGNLVCHGDEMISVSADAIASFYLADALRERVAKAGNSDDPQAVCDRAELLLHDGKREEALNLLRQVKDDNFRARSLLVKTILSLLRDDFVANRALLDEVTPLIDQPAQRRELLQLHAKGLEEAGLVWDAFQTYLKLELELGAGQPQSPEYGEGLIDVERDLRVRAERWLHARLAGLFEKAASDVQQQMTAAIEQRLSEATERGTIPALRQFVERYGYHPAAGRARLELADRLLAANQWLEAEMLATGLRESSDRELAGRATALLAALYSSANRNELAAREFLSLQSRYSDLVCRDGQTGQQFAEKGLARAAIVQENPQRTWPGGKVTVDPGDAEASNSRFGAFQSAAPVQISQWQGIPSYALRATFDSQQYAIMVRDGFGRVMVNASLRTSEMGVRRYYPIQQSSLNGRALGHLLLVHLGAEIVAIDGLRSQRPASEVILWRQELIPSDPAGQRNFYATSRQITNPILGTRLVHYDPSGQVSFATGPATSMGFCFLKGKQLTCIDPTTGQIQWERTGMEATSELFGDDDLIFVAPTNGEEALVLSAVDGSLLGKRKVGRADQRLATYGRNLLTYKQEGGGYRLEVRDAWAEGEPLWSKQVPQGVKADLIDGDELAVLDLTGKLTLVSLETGRERFTAQLEAEKSLTALSVLRSSDQYMVVAHQPLTDPTPGMMVQPVASPVSATHVVHGRVYALNHEGKMQWPVPAFITQHHLLREQPAESPLLFFLRSVRGASDARWASQALVLDKRTGSIVLEGDVNQAQTSSAEVTVDPAKAEVSLKLWFSPGTKVVTFKLTDTPVPPEPPAQTGSQASSSVGEKSGTVTNVANAIFRVLSQRARDGAPPKIDPVERRVRPAPAPRPAAAIPQP